MTMIKNLLFDFGGVLCDLNFDDCLNAFRGLGSSLQSFKENEELVAILQRMDRGTATVPEFMRELRKVCEIPCATDQQLLYAWNKILGGIPTQRYKALKQLKKNYSIYLLSNCNDPHWNFVLENYSEYKGENFIEWFKQIFLSFKMHLEKPEQAIYETVAQEACIRPEETLFIDDHQENIDGAMSVGFHGLCALGDEWIKQLVNKNLDKGNF